MARRVAKGEDRGMPPIVARGVIEGDDTTRHEVDNRLSDSIISGTEYLLRHMIITSFCNNCRGNGVQGLVGNVFLHAQSDD